MKFKVEYCPDMTPAKFMVDIETANAVIQIGKYRQTISLFVPPDELQLLKEAIEKAEERQA